MTKYIDFIEGTTSGSLITMVLCAVFGALIGMMGVTNISAVLFVCATISAVTTFVCIALVNKYYKSQEIDV